MNSLPAETSFLAVACPRCHAAIAVPRPLFGQPASCPICAGGFRGPQVVPPPPVVSASPATSPPQGVQPPQPASPPAVSPPGAISPPLAAPPPAPAEPDIPQELQLFDTSGPPPQTISHGGQVIELRRLTPEEKAARRTRRTIVTIGTGTAILFAIVLLATRGGGKQKRR